MYALSVENAIEYGDLREEWAKEPDVYKPAPQGAEIVLLPKDAVLSGDIALESGFEAYPGLYSNENETPESVLVSGDNECAAAWKITVEQPGLYELKVSYLALGGNEIKVQRKITIDGETPYEEANNLCFYRVFEEEIQPDGKMRLNAINDEVWPHMIEKRVWQTVRAVDQQAIYVDPLQFYLSAGEQEIVLEYVDQPVVLGNIAFVSPIVYPAYKEKLAEWQAAGYKNVSDDTVIKLQAENSAWRSENVIRRESDADPLTEPKSGANRVLNIVGGYRWRLGNAAVSWDIDVPETGLDTPEAYKAFKAWTDMYANYEIDAESNFFTRIRTGTMPVGIGNFTTYMQLMTSAPELYGRWSIAPVPGTRQADGTVKHTVRTTAATADIILSQSEKKDAAWEFLKWWSSEETQTRYGRELEAILGMGVRWNTANVNAFYSLPWDARHERVIRAQMDAAEEQLIVPGGYFTGRHIINAWNRVCINNENARDALEKAVKDINKELHNKRVEFGLE